MPAFWPDGRISTSLYDTEKHAGVMAVQIWFVSVAVQPHSRVSKNLPQKFEHGKFQTQKSIVGGSYGRSATHCLYQWQICTGNRGKPAYF
jgi:hypothetical protein